MLLYAPDTVPVGAVVFPHSGARLPVVDFHGHAAILDVPTTDEFAIRDLGFTDDPPGERAVPAEGVVPAQPTEPVAEQAAEPAAEVPHEEGEMLPPVAEHQEGEGQ